MNSLLKITLSKLTFFLENGQFEYNLSEDGGLCQIACFRNRTFFLRAQNVSLLGIFKTRTYNRSSYSMASKRQNSNIIQIHFFQISFFK